MKYFTLISMALMLLVVQPAVAQSTKEKGVDTQTKTISDINAANPIQIQFGKPSLPLV